MRKRIKNVLGKVVTLGMLFSLFGSSALAAQSPVVEIGKSPEASGIDIEPGIDTAPGIDIARLQAAQDTNQVITVVGTGMDSSHVQVTYYKKSEEGIWTEAFSVPGYCGHNGMAVDKREGDRRTPVGTYSFISAFGSLEDPGSILPYKTLDSYDYWVDDSSSSHYNQMVSTRTTPVDWNSAEHLIGVMPQYRYSLALDYNTTERTPGKGSAIFLHGYHTWKTWTEGCIAIPEDHMKTLIQNVDANTRIVIVPEESELTYVEVSAE